MSDNWIALLCSIVTKKSIDESLGAMNIRPKKTLKQKLNLSDEDIELILFLKKTQTWSEIAKEFGVTANYMCQLCSIYKKKKAIEGAPTKVSPTISFNKKSISL